MIYNSNPYKRKMESMQVNVAPSVPIKSDKSAEPTPEQVPAQDTVLDPVQPLEQPVPSINVTPYVPEVEGVEVPVVSLEDVEPSNPVEETTEAAQPAEESPAEVAESEIEETLVVESSELPNPEQPEEVVGAEPVEEVKAETPVDATGEEAAAEEAPATHYFYCTKPDGKEVVYKRNTASASYESEITSFRKHLEKEGIIINKEEIK